MLFHWFRHRRRRKLLASSFPPDWRTVLRDKVRHYRYLDDGHRQRLEGFIQVLIEEKEWVACDDLILSDDKKVRIAGNAGIMTLGLPEPYYFDRLDTIIVHPASFLPARSRFDLGHHLDADEPRFGEAWQRGPVVLSWGAIGNSNAGNSGHNLVIHEFAHHVDGLDGEMDGVPPLSDQQRERQWYRVTEQEFLRLRQHAERGQATLLDTYGATNHAEFFAVASECFFERPHAMRERHAGLYQVLMDFYGQDVAAWLPDAAGPSGNPLPDGH